MCNSEAINFDLMRGKIDAIWSEKEEVKEDLIKKVQAMKKRAMLNGELLENLISDNEK